MFLGVVLGGALGFAAGEGEAFAVPLLATQILWINLLTDTFPALALGVDPHARDLMERPPRAPGERVIDREMQVGIGLVGLVMAAVTLSALDLKLLWGAIALSVVLQVAVVHVPLLNSAFSTAPLSLADWLGGRAQEAGQPASGAREDRSRKSTWFCFRAMTCSMRCSSASERPSSPVSGMTACSASIVSSSDSMIQSTACSAFPPK